MFGLTLEVLYEELLEYFILEPVLVFQDLKYEQRRQDVLLSDRPKRCHQLIITPLLVSEVGQGLDPQIAIDLIILGSKCMTLAYLEHLL